MVPETTAETAAATAPADASETEDEPFDRERALATIRKLREIEKAHKTTERSNAQLQARLKQIEDRDMSELDKTKRELLALQAERDNLVQQQAHAAVERAVLDAASRAGARRPAGVLRLAEAETEADADQAVAQVKRDYPELFGPAMGTADGGAQNTGDVARGMNSLIRQMAGR